MKSKSRLLPLAPALVALMMLPAPAGTASAQCCPTFTVDGPYLDPNCFPVYFDVLWNDGTVQRDSLMGPGIQTYPVLATACPPDPFVYVISILPKEGCCIRAQITSNPPPHCSEIVLENC